VGRSRGGEPARTGQSQKAGQGRKLRGHPCPRDCLVASAARR
jgi:hypothetical protein